MTEKELRLKQHVTITDAALYLGIPRDRLRAQSKRGLWPFVIADKEPGANHRWTFYINVEELIKYKKGSQLYEV